MKNNDFIKVENKEGEIVLINLSKLQNIYPDRNIIYYPQYWEHEDYTALTPESMQAVVEHLNNIATDLKGEIKEKIEPYKIEDTSKECSEVFKDKKNKHTLKVRKYNHSLFGFSVDNATVTLQKIVGNKDNLFVYDSSGNHITTQECDAFSKVEFFNETKVLDDIGFEKNNIDMGTKINTEGRLYQ